MGKENENVEIPIRADLICPFTVYVAFRMFVILINLTAYKTILWGKKEQTSDECYKTSPHPTYSGPNV